jgi:hypothetical protein
VNAAIQTRPDPTGRVRSHNPVFIEVSLPPLSERSWGSHGLPALNGATRVPERCGGVPRISGGTHRQSVPFHDARVTLAGDPVSTALQRTSVFPGRIGTLDGRAHASHHGTRFLVAALPHATPLAPCPTSPPSTLDVLRTMG